MYIVFHYFETMMRWDERLDYVGLEIELWVLNTNILIFLSLFHPLSCFHVLLRAIHDWSAQSMLPPVQKPEWWSGVRVCDDYSCRDDKFKVVMSLCARRLTHWLLMISLISPNTDRQTGLESDPMNRRSVPLPGTVLLSCSMPLFIFTIEDL